MSRIISKAIHWIPPVLQCGLANRLGLWILLLHMTLYWHLSLDANFLRQLSCRFGTKSSHTWTFILRVLCLLFGVTSRYSFQSDLVRLHCLSQEVESGLNLPICHVSSWPETLLFMAFFLFFPNWGAFMLTKSQICLLFSILKPYTLSPSFQIYNYWGMLVVAYLSGLIHCVIPTPASRPLVCIQHSMKR